MLDPCKNFHDYYFVINRIFTISDYCSCENVCLQLKIGFPGENGDKGKTGKFNNPNFYDINIKSD